MSTGPATVLVVGINYAPEHTGIAPYTTAAVHALVTQGHRVTVRTGIPHYPGWTVPARYRFRRRSREQIDGVAIDRLRHFVPRRQDALRRAWYELSFGLQVLLDPPRQPPDVVLAVVPSLFGAVAAARLADRCGARLVVWVQDSMAAAAQQSGIPGGGRVAGAARRLERFVLRRADRVVVVSDGFRPTVEAMGVEPDRIVTLPNWSHLVPTGADRDATRDHLGWAADDLIVLHSGNMGLKQDLASVVETARLAARSGGHIRIVLMGDGSQRADLETRVAGVEGIEVVDPLPDDRYAAALEAADVLLVNERPGVVDMSLPSKLTSYFAAGRPVVAAVDASGGTAAEIRRSGGGVITGEHTPAGLLATLTDLLADPARMTELGRSGRHHAETELTAAGSLDRLVGLVATPYRPREPERVR